MFQTLSIVILLAIFSESLCCKLENNYDDVRLCKSWKELSSARSHPEWKKLILKNPGNLEKIVLKNDVFKDFSNLETLMIVGMINKLEPKAFQNLKNLKKLHLIDNPIEKLPDGIFEHLEFLTVLELKNLGLMKIIPGFANKIEFVTLEGNYINPGTIFKNSDIVHLNLINNSISKLEYCAFCGMKKLKFLHLDMNQLTSFDPVKILGENKVLIGISLGQNKLTIVPKFDFYPELRGVTVGNNSIEKIELYSFVKCPKFNLLDVPNNKLKEIPANIFPEFSPDRKDPAFLIIHGNQLQCLSQELRDKIKTLRELTLSDNPWKCECLLDIISWAKVRNSWLGCVLTIKDCRVSCIDKDNKKQIIDVEKQYKQ